MTSVRAERADDHPRAFRKLRAWVALGTPLELLSPLSVARVLGLLLLVAWPLAGSVGRGAASPWLVVPTVATGVIVVGLLRARTLSRRGCHLLVLFASVTAGFVVYAGHGHGAAIVASLAIVPAAAFSGLFLDRGALVVHGVVAAAAIGIATSDQLGPGRATVIGLLIVQAVLAVALTVGLVTGSARRAGTVDPDTGLPNGFGLAGIVDTWPHPRTLVVATVMLPGLADAREALGYRHGAELLRRAVEDIGQVLPATAVIGRVDGDMLVVVQRVLGDVVDHESAASSLADRVASAIGSGRYLVDGIEVVLRTNIGLAIAPEDSDETTELLRLSALAARRAHADGAARARWDGSTEAMTSDDLALLADLRLAAERQELWLAYQPQIATGSGDTVSVEALLRWTSPRLGSVPPGAFIRLAERTGLIDPLTDWVLAEALDAQVRWRSLGVTLPVSINLSPLSLSDPELPHRVTSALERRGLPPEVLVVEVTETTAVDVVDAVDRLRPLHDLGIRVSIDDFGAGYTSLSVLPHLPVDELKVDQRFVRAAPTSPADEAIVRSVSELGHRLGLETVAEGVETEEISALMSAFGFDLLQGYHFARPLPEDDLLAFLTTTALRA